jgi:hypothetical protein
MHGDGHAAAGRAESAMAAASGVAVLMDAMDGSRQKRALKREWKREKSQESTCAGAEGGLWYKGRRLTWDIRRGQLKARATATVRLRRQNGAYAGGFHAGSDTRDCPGAALRTPELREPGGTTRQRL